MPLSPQEIAHASDAEADGEPGGIDLEGIRGIRTVRVDVRVARVRPQRHPQRVKQLKDRFISGLENVNAAIEREPVDSVGRRDAAGISGCLVHRRSAEIRCRKPCQPPAQDDDSV
jgi:hypothetical protein